MNTNDVLAKALMQRGNDYSAAVDRLRTRFEEEPEAFADVGALREAVELVRCLRRLVPVCSLTDIHKAFGAPGDFGYETPIGDALSRLYRGE